MEKAKVQRRAWDERFPFLMDRQEGHPHCSVFWAVTASSGKGRNFCPHDMGITSSPPTDLKHLSVCLSKILIHFMVKWLASHPRIGQGKRSPCNNLEVPAKIYHQYKLVSGLAVDCFQLNFHPTDSSSLIPRHRVSPSRISQKCVYPF